VNVVNLHFRTAAVATAAVTVMCSLTTVWADGTPAGSGNTMHQQNPIRQGHHVTYEIAAKLAGVQPANAKGDLEYRLNPSIYVATLGDEVTLNIQGLAGDVHQVMLSGYNVHASQHHNTAVLNFKANRAGIFPLVSTGRDAASTATKATVSRHRLASNPVVVEKQSEELMRGYLVVVKRYANAPSD
jgi:hypothetical protein